MSEDCDASKPAANGRREFLKRTGVFAASAGVTTLIGCAHAEPLRTRDVRHWDTTADVVVMGSGVAGTAAAIEARRGNAEVLLLEKFHVPGGSSSLSGGVCYMGGGTPLQKALGFTDTLDDMYNYMVAASGIYAEHERIRCQRPEAEYGLDHQVGLVGETTQRLDRRADHHRNGQPHRRPHLPVQFQTRRQPADAQVGAQL